MNETYAFHFLHNYFPISVSVYLTSHYGFPSFCTSLVRYPIPTSNVLRKWKRQINLWRWYLTDFATDSYLVWWVSWKCREVPRKTLGSWLNTPRRVSCECKHADVTPVPWPDPQLDTVLSFVSEARYVTPLSGPHSLVHYIVERTTHDISLSYRQICRVSSSSDHLCTSLGKVLRRTPREGYDITYTDNVSLLGLNREVFYHRNNTDTDPRPTCSLQSPRNDLLDSRPKESLHPPDTHPTTPPCAGDRRIWNES